MNWFNRMKVFLSEVRSEMKKVTYPSREEVVGTTIVVVVTSFIFAFYLFAADFVIMQIYEAILNVF